MDETQMLTTWRYRDVEGGEYEVVGIATHTETHELMVVYRPLSGEGGLVVRPLAMFVERVVRDSIEQPRFVRIADAP